jgi:hypothetical protein
MDFNGALRPRKGPDAFVEVHGEKPPAPRGGVKAAKRPRKRAWP